MCNTSESARYANGPLVRACAMRAEFAGTYSCHGKYNDYSKWRTSSGMLFDPDFDSEGESEIEEDPAFPLPPARRGRPNPQSSSTT